MSSLAKASKEYASRCFEEGGKDFDDDRRAFEAGAVWFKHQVAERIEANGPGGMITYGDLEEILKGKL